MNVLACFAHPDDEVLGCGGALAKHAENGDSVVVIVLAERHLYKQLVCAVDVLAGKDAAMAAGRTLPDQAFERVPFSQIVEFAGDYSGDIIYTHHPGDLNQDHALTARAVLTAFRPKPGEKPRTILACEVLSSTEYTFPPQFSPNYFVALSGEQLQKKVDALACYETEIQPWPHPRSALGVRNLAAYRGQQVGVEAAEAFELLRSGPN